MACEWITDSGGRLEPRALERRLRPSRERFPGGPGRLSGRTASAVRLAAALLLVVLLPGATLVAQAHEALQRAARLVGEGRLDEAEQQARLALSDPETRAVARSILGAIRLQQDRLGDSAQLLEEAIRLEPGLVGTHLTLAQVYTRQGREGQAIEVFRRVLELDPSNAAARMALAGLEAAKNHCTRSLELARPALTAFEASPGGLLLLATCYLKTGARDSVARLAAKWKGLADVPAAASVRFAERLAADGLVAEAIDVLEHAADLDPSSYEVAFALGGAYLRLESRAWALESYDRALRLQPESIPALRQAAVTAERAGQLERSLSYWVRARKLAPEEPEVHLGFGRVCLKLDLLDDAEPALVRAASLRPDEPAYQYTLATLRVGKKQFEEAQALLEPLVLKRPGDARLQYALGSVLYTRGHLEESAARLRESLRLEPDQVASRYYLALVARDQGRHAEAIEGLEELLRLYPNHAQACEVLGGLLMNEQRHAEAESFLRRAIHFNPESMRANYQLGLLLARTGRKEEAARQLERASTLREDDEAGSRLQLRLLDPEP